MVLQKLRARKILVEFHGSGSLIFLAVMCVSQSRFLFEVYTQSQFFARPIQGRSQDFSKGGHTVQKRGYSSHFHIVFTTCYRLFQTGGHTVPKQGYSPHFHVVFTTCHGLFA